MITNQSKKLKLMSDIELQKAKGGFPFWAIVFIIVWVVAAAVYIGSKLT
jgi:hypothetical protein